MLFRVTLFCVVSLLFFYVGNCGSGSSDNGLSSVSSYGTHGALHPKNKPSDGKVNPHKLEIFFDDDCELEEGTALEYYFALIEAFADCLGNNTNYTQNLFSTPSGHWFGYIELIKDNCEDELDVVYEEYCIADFEYEPLIEYRSSYCTSDSCSMPSGYTPSSYAPNSQCQWHLDYIDGTEDSSYNDHIESTNKDVDIYIIDTGVLSTHNEFSGRVTWLDNGYHDSDSYISSTHGTHCAGIAGGDTSGVSRGATIFSARQCFNCGSQGTDTAMQAVIDSMESRNRRSVVSMSWGWTFSSSDFTKYNDFFDTMADLGGVMFAATTNSYTEHTTPCSANGKDGPGGCDSVITVSNYMSNWNLNSAGYGACVDVAGPGTEVTSAISDCKSCYAEYTGTSMATPAIAGFVVNMLNYDSSLTQSQIVSILSDSSASTPIWTNAGYLPGVSADCDTIKNLIDGGGSGGDDDDDDDDDDNDSGGSDGFVCNNGCTIPWSWQNDGYYCDCSNCEDESGCSCPSGGCVSYCGGYVAGDCSSSEEGGYWGDDGLFVCADGCQVPYATWVNDGVYCDCSNCEDEDTCSCPSGGCQDYCDGYVLGSCSSSKQQSSGGTDGNADDDTRRDGKTSSGSSGNDNNNDNDNTIIYICIGVGGGLMLILLIGAIIIMVKKRKEKQQMVGYNPQQQQEMTSYSQIQA